ncbi:plasmid mobilization protein [Escherichia coli]|nr:plasmid mobilization protein [Shigella flexneri]EGE2783616.1 plasmid mobilization protein [Escherichia coli]PSF73312.1 plasmid mobilization protein [Escherichia coli]
MRLKFIRRDRGSFSGGLLPFLPVCCRDRAERVLAVRVTDVMVNNILYSLFIPAFC